MAVGEQDVGFGKDLVFAGDPLRLAISVVTGGTAAGVTAAEWGLFSKIPKATEAIQTAEVSKTLGAGITVADGDPGTVIVSIVATSEDTAPLAGVLYHELRLTTSGETFRVASGKVLLQYGAL